MDFELTVSGEETPRVKVEVMGDVTIHTATRLRERLEPLLSDKYKEVRVNLEGVNFMDSAGIATLVEGLQWSKSSGGRFVLAGLTENVRDVFALAKLDTIFDIEDSPKE